MRDSADRVGDWDDLTQEDRQALAKQFSAHADPRKFDWNWREINFNRVALVNYVVSRLPRDASYLEIGCARNVLFDAVPLADKTGVDPVAGGTERMTSDAFFETNAKLFDFVWIDGLHEYQQVHRDLENSLRFMKPGGWIGLHDLLPRHWKEEHMPRISAGWTGDVWKVAFEIMRTHGLDFRIVFIDHGVGLVKVAPDHAPLADLRDELAEARFGYLYENVSELPLRSWDEAIAWIESFSPGAR